MSTSEPVEESADDLCQREGCGHQRAAHISADGCHWATSKPGHPQFYKRCECQGFMTEAPDDD